MKSLAIAIQIECWYTELNGHLPVLGVFPDRKYSRKTWWRGVSAMLTAGILQAVMRCPVVV